MARCLVASLIEEMGDFVFARLGMRDERRAERCLRWRGMPGSNVNSCRAGVWGSRARLAAFASGALCSLGVQALHFVIDNALADATI